MVMQSDSELPRHRCTGVDPSSHRLWCQTSKKSFGNAGSREVFAFLQTVFTSQWAITGLDALSAAFLSRHKGGKGKSD